MAGVANPESGPSLYPAVGSDGAAIDFQISAHRGTTCGQTLFRKALPAAGHPASRVIMVVAEFKQQGRLGRPGTPVFSRRPANDSEMPIIQHPLEVE